MDVDYGQFPQPSVHRAFHQNAAVRIQGDPQKTGPPPSPQGEDLHLLFLGAGSSVFCEVDIFSNKACSISQLEDLSPITWKRDE